MSEFYVKPPENYDDTIKKTRFDEEYKFIELVDHKSNKFKFLPQNTRLTPPLEPTLEPPPEFASSMRQKSMHAQDYNKYVEFDYLPTNERILTKQDEETYENFSEMTTATPPSINSTTSGDHEEFTNNFILKSKTDKSDFLPHQKFREMAVDVKETNSTIQSNKHKSIVDIFPQIKIKSNEKTLCEEQLIKTSTNSRFSKKSSKPNERYLRQNQQLQSNNYNDKNYYESRYQSTQQQQEI